MNKHCHKCNNTKPTTEFYKNRKRIDGLAANCKTCDNVRIRKYQQQPEIRELRKLDNQKRRKNRAAYYAKYAAEYRLKHKIKAIEMLGNQCADCKQQYPTSVYDFHHLDPLEKDAPPASILNKSWDNITKELSKCILLCANCHRIRHHEQD